VIIPQEYIVQKFYQYAGYPKFKRTTNTYIAGCPVCREGKSWLKKRRCIYIVEDNIICCHNCGWYSDPIKWIQEVANITFGQIIEESKNYEILPLESFKEEKKIIKQLEKLPNVSINLFDSSQVDFFKNNDVVIEANNLIKNRLLNKAINRPEALFVSLTDKTHKNRLIIPFYNENKDIIFYQSRAIYSQDLKFYPKYLSKINGEKSLFNIHKVSSNIDYIFIFEGPIDSFFVENGVAVAGIQENSSAMFSRLQELQLTSFLLHKKIWVLDNQWLDKASYNKTLKLIENGETVFIWPEELSKKYKDINDLCIDKNLSKIDSSFLINNSFSDLKAKLKLSVVRRN
jgi:hypothetical protein